MEPLELDRIRCEVSRGLQVFRKQLGTQLTVYLGKRDFVDHLDRVDPVDGVVLVDPEYLKDRKVFVTLTCAFRYGREDLDVLGLSFRKDLFSATCQAVPPCPRSGAPPPACRSGCCASWGPTPTPSPSRSHRTCPAP
ncbi:unnamed protein product [Natator depressus]